jgi:hypothetical protein
VGVCDAVSPLGSIFIHEQRLETCAETTSTAKTVGFLLSRKRHPILLLLLLFAQVQEEEEERRKKKKKEEEEERSG